MFGSRRPDLELAPALTRVNLIGKSIASREDVAEAQDAILEAQKQMKILAQAREILESRGNINVSSTTDETKDDSRSGSEDEYSREDAHVPISKTWKDKKKSHEAPDVLILHS